ncbi:MAG: aminoglycoside N(3)-acetyltransferase [Candidatus Sericytochromatia bacterium]
MSEAQAVTQLRAPLTVARLSAELRQLGVKPGMALLVHSSLSALGWVCGGAQAVVLALEEALGPTGTLMMPTHSSGLSEPSRWQNPPVPPEWWPVIRAEMPAFDPSSTPSQGMGAIPECFRSQPGVLRSAHPQVSFAARGPLASQLLEPHPLEDSLGDTSPLGKLYAHNGQVLLLGVGHDRNTSLHLAEYRADYPGKAAQLCGAPLMTASGRVWQTYRDQIWDESDFAALGGDFQRDQPLALQEALIGAALCQLMPQRVLVDYAVGWMARQRR